MKITFWIISVEHFIEQQTPEIVRNDTVCRVERSFTNLDHSIN